MHLSSELALDLLEGRLPHEEESFWYGHAEGCMECRAEISNWREFKTDLSLAHLQSAPEEAVKRVIESFPAAPGERALTSRLIWASLVFDSFFEPALAGGRGAAAAARQLVMRAEEFDIHIKIWGELDHRQMLGQILPRSETRFVESAKLHLMQNGERIETATADETGEFHFTDLPEGSLSIQIDLPNLTVVGALNFREIP